MMSSATKQHSSQAAVQPSPWRQHYLVRFILPILAMYAVAAFYTNSKSNDNGQGRTGMAKLLNQPVMMKEHMQEEQPNLNDPVQEHEQTGLDFLDPVDIPAGAPGIMKAGKSTKAEGESKSKGSKSAKAEGAKASGMC